ncbi:MAG: hypothetical protein L0206_12845, partial [Actinobacteria bacterium]|nr:hypothetical protein [Actinomycetota bacterium]
MLRFVILLPWVGGCGGVAAGVGVLVGLAEDARTGEVLPRALVAIEEGGLYVDNPNVDADGQTVVGNPSFAFGAIADDAGAFQVELPDGDAGVHVFVNGYRYGSERVSIAGETHQTVPLEVNLPADSAPVASNLRFEPASVPSGGSF